MKDTIGGVLAVVGNGKITRVSERVLDQLRAYPSASRFAANAPFFPRNHGFGL